MTVSNGPLGRNFSPAGQQGTAQLFSAGVQGSLPQQPSGAGGTTRWPGPGLQEHAANSVNFLGLTFLACRSTVALNLVRCGWQRH